MARRRKLSPERKEFINGLLEHYQPNDAHDVQEMLKDLLGDTLQGMLEAEMDEKLGYSKYDYKNKDTDDSRNGYSRMDWNERLRLMMDEAPDEQTRMDIKRMMDRMAN